jgi:hypothetical protein
MSPDAKKAIWIGVATLGLMLCAMILGLVLGSRGCGRDMLGIRPVTGIDAGPGDHAIAARLDADVQAEEARIRELEVEHQREIAAMGAQEQADYQAARARGRDALAIWFKERTARLLSDGGPAALW